MIGTTSAASERERPAVEFITRLFEGMGIDPYIGFGLVLVFSGAASEWSKSRPGAIYKGGRYYSMGAIVCGVFLLVTSIIARILGLT